MNRESAESNSEATLSPPEFMIPHHAALFRRLESASGGYQLIAGWSKAGVPDLSLFHDESNSGTLKIGATFLLRNTPFPFGETPYRYFFPLIEDEHPTHVIFSPQTLGSQISRGSLYDSEKFQLQRGFVFGLQSREMLTIAVFPFGVSEEEFRLIAKHWRDETSYAEIFASSSPLQKAGLGPKPNHDFKDFNHE